MNLPPAIDLRPAFRARGLTPRAQGKRGTCSLFALVAVVEFEQQQHRTAARGERLSVEFLNWASHQTNGRATDGSFFSDALEGLRRFGVCAEPLMPYAADRFDAKAEPPPAALREAIARRGVVAARWFKEWDVATGLSEKQLTAVRASLAEGHPVAAGLRWPKRAEYRPPAPRLLNHPPPAEVFDGHSVVLVGYEDDPALPGGGAFLFRNSSGPDWEDAGHACLTYDYARAYANDAVGLVPERR